jgi:phosphate transport system substrate-binding protein
MRTLSKRDIVRWCHWATVLVCMTMPGACSTSKAPTREHRAEKPVVPRNGVLLQGAGATFPAVLYEKWFNLYAAEHPSTVITYDAVGSGEGTRRFIGRNIELDEEVDFGASDAAMRDDELAEVPSGATLVPLAAGSVALAYNLPDGPIDLKLSREAYAAIFMGKITSWDDPRIVKTNPGVRLPKLTITTVVRQDGSGTTFAFTKRLDAISDLWRSQYGAATLVNWPGNSMRASGNEGVAGRITHAIGSVGYVSYEFAIRAGLHVALLENHAGKFVPPSSQSAASALAGAEPPENMRLYVPDPSADEAYPIVTLTWVLLYNKYTDAAKLHALQDLFRWCLTEGQKYAPELGYTRLPPNIVNKSQVALDRLQVASTRS